MYINLLGFSSSSDENDPPRKTEVPEQAIIVDKLSPKISRQDLFPVKDFLRSSRDWKSAGGVFVVYAKKVRRITLQRVLVSKLAFELEKFEVKDLLVIFDNQIILQEMAEKNKEFNEKFGKSLEVLTKILKNSKISSHPSKEALRRLSLILKDGSLSSFLIPHRNLSHTSAFFRGKFEVRQGIKSGTPSSKLPLKRFIGIGYKDKGTARNKAKDGSPSWQQVAKARLWEILT